MKKLIVGISTAVVISGFIIYQKPVVRDWVDVNLLTVSTKAKQKKLLALALAHPERVDYLRRAEDMAEKIIFLDGKEVEIGYKFEQKTRGLDIESRIQNRKMFEYLVNNYQFSQSDIERHKAVLGEHMAVVEELAKDIDDSAKRNKISQYLAEARKFQKAGLNIESYEWMDKAKAICSLSLR